MLGVMLGVREPASVGVVAGFTLHFAFCAAVSKTILLVEKVVIRSVGSPKQKRNTRNQGQNATKAAFSAPENRGTREHEGVFQHAGSFLVQQLDAGYSTELPSSRGVLGSSGEPSLLLALAPAQRPERMP